MLLWDRPRFAAPIAAGGSFKSAAQVSPRSIRQTKPLLRCKKDSLYASSCQCVIGESTNLILRGLELVLGGDVIDLPEVMVLIRMPRAKRSGATNAIFKNSKRKLK